MLGVKDIAVIQKQDSTFLMCYTDTVGTKYYIRQKTSDNGVTWSSPSNVIQVTSGTGTPGLLQRDSGSVYLAYKKDSTIYIVSNSGSGWSLPVQTTGTTEGDPALLETDSDIVIIFKGADGHCYRISSTDGLTWSSPLQIAPNTAISDPATMVRKDRFYRITAQYISSSAVDLVKVLEFSYEGDSYLPYSCDVIIRDAQTLQSSMHLEYDPKGRILERISRDEHGVQTEKIVYTYNNNKVIREDVYAGNSPDISYSTLTGYDDKGNVTYTLRYKDPTGLLFHCIDTECQDLFDEGEDPPPDDLAPDGSHDEHKSREEECRECDCKDRPDIKTLRKLKTKVTLGELGVASAYALLCGVAGAMLCSGTGPGAAGCGIVAAFICGTAVGLLIDASVQDVIDDIHHTMDRLGCSCAIYCP
jgi:hypothetical protein